jgi:hypothetical protein
MEKTVHGWSVNVKYIEEIYEREKKEEKKERKYKMVYIRHYGG